MKRFTLFLALCTTICLHAISEKDIQRKSGSDLFGFIDAQKIATFSDINIPKSLIDPNALKNWIDLTNTANNVAKKETQNETIKKGIAQLDNILPIIETTVRSLHTVIPSINELINLQNELTHKKEVSEQLFETAMNVIAEPLHQKWLDNRPSPGKILSEKHSSFFDEYRKEPELSDGNLRNLLGKHAIIDLSKKSRFANLGSIGELQKNFEQFVFLLENSFRRPIFQRDKKIAAARKLLNHVKQLYPEMPRWKTELFANSNDKAAIILAAQAGAYTETIGRILRQLKALQLLQVFQK